MDSITPTDAAAERSAVVDLGAIAHNVRRLRELAAPAALMAVVKSDGYGHGMLPVAKTALDAGANWLGVAHVGEALQLRGAGIEAPILAWLHTPSTDFDAALAGDVDLGVSGWDLEPIADAARASGRTARLHLKIDTGLGRNGCTSEQWSQLVARARELENDGVVRVVGIFSHLAVADEPERTETDEQIAAFRDALKFADDAGLRPELRHLANSPATLTRPDARFDMVRTGISIYGLSPFADRTSADLGLIPAMTLRAQVANAKRVPAGQGVSYGLLYRTESPVRLALIPAGYADGVPRVATGAPVTIGGERYAVNGRIAMDQFVVDVDDHDVAPGDEAVLFGDPATGVPSADDWARAAGTINYEIVTRIGTRVSRVYIDQKSGSGDG